MASQSAGSEDGATLGQRAGAALIAAGARGLGRLRRERALELAERAGRSWARWNLPRTDTARRNLRIAFPRWSEAQRRALIEQAFGNLAQTALEFATVDRLDQNALRALCDIDGIEHLEEARQRTKRGGVIVLTAHFGNWELLLTMMSAHGYPIAVVHRARDNPAFDELVGSWRSESGADLLARGSAARAALRALAAGKILAMPLDQNCEPDEGIFVPFLGRLACVRDGPARIAMRTGAPVMHCFVERTPDRRHRVRASPPIELVTEREAGSAEAALRENVVRMIEPIEAAIRRAPEHWTWNHRRWRTQPAGEPRPYPSRRRRRAVA